MHVTKGAAQKLLASPSCSSRQSAQKPCKSYTGPDDQHLNSLPEERSIVSLEHNMVINIDRV